MAQREKVIILGSGPAGLAAAIYTARAQLEPLVITGNELGGQVATTNEVENYPGFPEGLTGPELVERFREQAEKFGARLEFDEAVAVEFREQPPHLVRTHGGEYEADAIIVAVGASPRKLGVPGEKELTGYGVSYCATCDGFFFRGKDVVVVGGGDSALEEGLFLTKFANSVRVIHRRDELRAGPFLQKRAFANDKMSFIWNTVVTAIEGDGKVERVKTRNVVTGEEGELETDGVFIYIGHYPNTDIFKGQLEMDDHGYILVDRFMRTNVEGVFAAGEAADPIYRQVATSAGDGVKAAMQVERYLSEKSGRELVGEEA
ncbi:thioredoxin reductase [Ardenticatena maritima]|uniref:Thioredoxin reductase n=1 Tax=Ardenticatena maritima TaxID=872965 RepID=A0A0M8K6E5_9CHLR|nr:thioredoxin-disulfide reductase [Ardenticatena maritima]KPL87682.1 thioredoxin reductase [Ardenticatena maritima]GAP62743.1 thioredoxin reductase [Ardenticatena maritima]